MTQIEDDEGRRLYTSDQLHRSRGDLETSPARRLPGVAPWPWPGGLGGDLPGELFFLQRPPGSSPLNVSVHGEEYHLVHLSSGHLTELTAGRTAGAAKDRVRIQGSPDDDQALVVSTRAPRRHFDVHHLRYDAAGAWRSVRVRNALVSDDRLRVHAPVAFDAVEISGTTSRRNVDVELRRYHGGKLTRRNLAQRRVPAGKAAWLRPTGTASRAPRSNRLWPDGQRVGVTRQGATDRPTRSGERPAAAARHSHPLLRSRPPALPPAARHRRLPGLSRPAPVAAEPRA